MGPNETLKPLYLCVIKDDGSIEPIRTICGMSCSDCLAAISKNCSNFRQLKTVMDL